MAKTPKAKTEETAPVDAGSALEDVLLKSHRLSVMLVEADVFAANDIGVGEWVLLKTLGDRKDVPLKEFSRAAGVSRQRLRKLMGELETKGFITTSSSTEGDKRTKQVSATAELPKVLAAVSERLHALAADASIEKQGKGLPRVVRSMEKLAKAIARQNRAEEAETAETAA